MVQRVTNEIWVCLDCRYTLEGVLDNAPDLVDTSEAIFAEWGTLDITNNEMCGEDDCVVCGYESFSKNPCDGCGNPLAGARFRFAVWGEI